MNINTGQDCNHNWEQECMIADPGINCSWTSVRAREPEEKLKTQYIKMLEIQNMYSEALIHEIWKKTGAWQRKLPTLVVPVEFMYK